jgi:hypothetical protein
MIGRAPARSWLNHYAFHLIQAHDVRSPIVELGRPRALMRSHLLRFLEIPTIGQVNHDPGCPESMQPILVAIRACP